jgi:uncharacterized surface protein with fasciclin (FAS1) repeats
MRRRIAGAFAGTLLLAACSGGGDEAADTAAKPSSQTLAAMVAQADDLSTVTETLKDAGLAQVFDGTAAYTLLAPQDAAFTSLGEAGTALRSAEQRPAMVAVLRDHIIPGYQTPADNEKAISLDDDGKVSMRTMAGHTLTFASSDGTITATGEGGQAVRFAGEALLASNGVAIPVDGLAIDVGGAAAAQ